MIDKQLQTLSCNPFILGSIFQAFYEGYGKEFCPISLHYIITPIVMYKETRDLFSTANKNSSLSKIIKENPIPLIELQVRLWKMRKLTNLSLITLHNAEKIELTSRAKVIQPLKYELIRSDVKPLLRSAHYLGIFFQEFDDIDIYRLFKIVP